MKINVIGGQLERSEIDAYLKYVSEKYTGRQIRQLDIVIDGEFINLKVHFSDMDFQRAFRSTVYLVNSMEKLNDAKQSEFSQKQRHKTEE